MRSWLLIAALAAGCGRFGFSGHETPGDGPGDGPRDSVDGTPDAPTYVCTGSEVCEGFESGLGVWMADPMVSIDTTRAHRGLSSVHVHSPAFGVATNSYQSLFESQTVSANINPFYVRAWLWLTALPATNNAMELITAERPGSAGDYVFVHSDRTSVYSQYDTTIMNTPTLIPTGGWFCLIWKVTRDTGTAGRLDLTGDVTVSLVGSKTDSSSTPMQYVTLGIGYSGTNVATAQPTQDLWIDDVIVSGTAVTCSD